MSPERNLPTARTTVQGLGFDFAIIGMTMQLFESGTFCPMELLVMCSGLKFNEFYLNSIMLLFQFNMFCNRP